jgi:hypothetical protein
VRHAAEQLFFISRASARSTRQFKAKFRWIDRIDSGIVSTLPLLPPKLVSTLHRRRAIWQGTSARPRKAGQGR